ncbi:MAG: 50S ribosomal protein L25 [Patescibacteria group bacterium]
MEILQSEKREASLKPKALRKQGLIPVVLYGPTIESVSLSLKGKDFEQVFRKAGESSLITLERNGETSPVLVHEVQRDHLSGSILHVDFYQPALDREIDVAIPLVFEGEAPAVNELGGTLMKNMYEVEVRALPQNLPHEITVSVERLATFEDSIALKDLNVAEGVRFLGDPEETVVHVVPPGNVEEELAQPVGEEQMPEVEGEKKEEQVPPEE